MITHEQVRKEGEARRIKTEREAFEINKLRDQFAMAALTGLINRGFTEFGNSEQAYANLSYSYADAMLKARSADDLYYRLEELEAENAKLKAERDTAIKEMVEQSKQQVRTDNMYRKHSNVYIEY